MNKGALVRIENISSKGDVLINEGATSSSFLLVRLVYHHPTQTTYQEEAQQTKSNIPTSINGLPTRGERKGLLRTPPMSIKSSVI